MTTLHQSTYRTLEDQSTYRTLEEARNATVTGAFNRSITRGTVPAIGGFDRSLTTTSYVQQPLSQRSYSTPGAYIGGEQIVHREITPSRRVISSVPTTVEYAPALSYRGADTLGASQVVYERSPSHTTTTYQQQPYQTPRYVTEGHSVGGYQPSSYTTLSQQPVTVLREPYYAPSNTAAYNTSARLSTSRVYM